MLSNLFHTLFYQPLYNGLVFFIGATPFLDVGIVVILFTFLVKLLLFPISKKSVQTQIKVRAIEPQVAKIKKQYQDNKQKQAEETMKLYKDNNINPFSGILLAFIQLPIIFALFFVFSNGGLPTVDTNLLYSFVETPPLVNMNFLGVINVGEQSVILALLVAISSFFQMHFIMSKTNKSQTSKENDFTRQLQSQMKYFFPVMTGFAAYYISGAISLYWITSNLFTIGQEVVLRKKSNLLVGQSQAPEA